MDNNKISDVIITLSALYELLLNIGQSFDIQENAETFLKTLMLQKNLSFAAYFTLNPPDKIIKVYSIPKTGIEQINIDAAFIQELIPKQFNIIKDANSCFKRISKLTKLQQKEFVAFFAGSKSLVFLGKKNDSFDYQDLVKNELVLSKFCLFMESLESHHKIKDEVKIKEEQAKIIKLNNEKLKKQNEELIKYIRSNNELEKFAYRVSHDLNSPLSTIIGFSNLLVGAGENLTEKQTQYLKYIVESGKQMKALITGILDYSKINGDALKLKKIDVYQLIEKIKNLIHHNLNETSGTIIVKNVPEFMIADETKIKQLFLNLISNALKFKKENEKPKVTVNGVVNEHELLFSISDNGIGIPAKNKDQIFDLFSKAQNNHHFEGHGIGLSICRQIITQHKGEIWIESEQGIGTIFHFTIQKMELT